MKTTILSHLPPGVIIRGNTLWISELSSIFFVSLFSVLLLALSLRIFTNEVRINKIKSSLAEKRTESIILSEFRSQLSEKASVARLLSTIAGKKLPRHVILDLAEIVYDNSTLFGYDPLLLLSVIKVESVFEPHALGRFRNGKESGAMGLMQLKFATAQEVARQLSMPPLSREDMFNPEINVILGTAYLTRMISKFKSFKLGILAYNQGPATIHRHLARKTPLSVAYYRKVLAAYYELKEKDRMENLHWNRR